LNINVIGAAANFKVGFANATLSSQAGAVLMKDFISRLSVAQTLDRQIEVKVRERGYSVSESILGLAFNLMLGGDCLDDLDVLRGDPGTVAILGVKSVIAPRTAGDFLRRFRIGDLCDFQRALRAIARRVRPRQTSEICTIDLDATILEQRSSRKEGSRMAYNGQIGYHPLVAFWAEEGEMLATHLMAGNRYPSSKARWFFKEVVMKAVPDGKKLQLRADSAFYIWKFIEDLEERDVSFAITADQTKGMVGQIEAIEEKAWGRYSNEPKAQVAEFFYAPKGQKERRYVVKRRLQTDRKTKKSSYVYHVVVTNDRQRTKKQLMKWALGRCNMENYIKEYKTGLGLEKMPTKKFHANWAWLLIGQLAFNLVAWFKRLCLPKSEQAATIKTLRHRLFNVAAKVVSSGRQFYLVISDDYSYQHLWSFALNKLATLAT
jgi:Transposase DDE domain group 1